MKNVVRQQKWMLSCPQIHKECRISDNIQSPDYDFLLRLHKDSDIINKAAQAKSLR